MKFAEKVFDKMEFNGEFDLEEFERRLQEETQTDERIEVFGMTCGIFVDIYLLRFAGEMFSVTVNKYTKNVIFQ